MLEIIHKIDLHKEWILGLLDRAEFAGTQEEAAEMKKISLEAIPMVLEQHEREINAYLNDVLEKYPVKLGEAVRRLPADHERLKHEAQRMKMPTADQPEMLQMFKAAFLQHIQEEKYDIIPRVQELLGGHIPQPGRVEKQPTGWSPPA